MALTLKVNGKTHQVEAAAEKPLLWVLREDLGLLGTKFGCGVAACGACTVHVDGQPMRSCQLPVGDVGEAAILTIEAVGETATGKTVVDAWVKAQVPQCGYCQAGQVMSATALLAATPKPTDDDIDAAMAGNICRCATYVRIRAAIKDAANAGKAAS